MPSSATILAMTAFAAVGRALTIDPSSVPMSIRQQWCESEIQTCPIICQQMEPGTTTVNTCDAETLTYGCLCGNNQRPNISEYSLTLPYFVCTEWGNQCVKACGDDTCRSNCRQQHPCGALNPKRVNTTTTTSATPTATGGKDGIFTDTAGLGGTGSKGAGSTLDAGRTYGLAVVLSGLFAGFALL